MRRTTLRPVANRPHPSFLLPSEPPEPILEQLVPPLALSGYQSYPKNCRRPLWDPDLPGPQPGEERAAEELAGLQRLKRDPQQLAPDCIAADHTERTG